MTVQRMSSGEDAQDKFDAIRDTQPIKNAREVSADRGHAQLHRRRDLFVPITTKHQLDNSRLLRRKRKRFDHALPQFGRNHGGSKAR